MNIRELFDVEMVVSFEVEKLTTLSFHFRTAQADEEMEYRRRTSRQRIRENGTLESTDIALKAPLWLFNKICTKVTMQNGNGQPAEQLSAQDISAIPDQLKLEAVASARGRVKKKDDEALSD